MSAVVISFHACCNSLRSNHSWVDFLTLLPSNARRECTIAPTFTRVNADDYKGIMKTKQGQGASQHIAIECSLLPVKITELPVIDEEKSESFGKRSRPALKGGRLHRVSNAFLPPGIRCFIGHKIG